MEIKLWLCMVSTTSWAVLATPQPAGRGEGVPSVSTGGTLLTVQVQFKLPSTRH